MQMFYNKQNIKLNFLSCYVKYFRNDNNLYFVNTLFDTDLELNSTKENIDLLLLELQRGVTTKKLLSILKKFSNANEELYVHMLQQGIIE